MRRTLHQHHVIDDEGRTCVPDNHIPEPTPSPPQQGRTLAGIDAAITACHHLAIRSEGSHEAKRSSVQPTLEGLRILTKPPAGYDNIEAAVEPTSMTWLPLAIAVESAGGTMHMVGARHSARLRGAIAGKSKSDVIDTDVLTHAR